jgi:hypothetical protein
MVFSCGAAWMLFARRQLIRSLGGAVNISDFWTLFERSYRAGGDMEDREVQNSPQIYARIGGVLYLIIIVIGFLGEFFVRDSLIVSGDATTTAKRIMASEFLWRVGIAAEYFLLICAVALLLILYRLLKPVSRDLALLAVFFNLVSITIEAVTALYLMQTLFPLGYATYQKVLDP